MGRLALNCYLDCFPMGVSCILGYHFVIFALVIYLQLSCFVLITFVGILFVFFYKWVFIECYLNLMYFTDKYVIVSKCEHITNSSWCVVDRYELYSFYLYKILNEKFTTVMLRKKLKYKSNDGYYFAVRFAFSSYKAYRNCFYPVVE